MSSDSLKLSTAFLASSTEAFASSNASVTSMVASVGALGFCLLLFWFGAHYWYEAWSKDWHSDTLWRVPLWIPHLSLPVGMGILSLQYVAEILSLVTGRTLPFGLPPKTGTEALIESFPAHVDTLT